MSIGDFHRGRRLRRTSALRGMVRETELRPADLIQGYFVVESGDRNFEKPIPSMPGQSQFSVDRLVARVGAAMDKGLTAAILFGLPEKKDPAGTGAYADDGIVQRAVMRLKETYPDLVVVTDVCLCEYTSHGHCGLLDGHGEVQNDPTLDLLAKTAVSQARAGADIIAPSDMMDGRVAAIRGALDGAGFSHIPIMSYAVKYASAFYGPFREAADSAPAFGDRKGYQMDPANVREGLREAAADFAEGADILMVKPAMPYLDVIRLLRDTFDTPIAAYQVSGEYAMLMAAINNGWLDRQRSILEALTGIKRAGADMIITYFAEEVLDWL
ncbi:Porphobilinogen synthase [Solidesulfovibrio carbinoliphilus subsp. oakridgensis]|uniref:Delta-aminolevulinic acid dehydratase n=1 Tax=Solidesulfovibrio carbinoliphilus subsp. oakridgensis TaxID=694327 RepID=G7QAE7_9BACT|nr:porphobilinogen synthase [Solidesulfovibrio carbinoliphilus]EHJ48700.1 Porphobilinogen synthase [Solidesulfovibrio carbinoliphilus subsp. oakridgensis]